MQRFSCRTCTLRAAGANFECRIGVTNLFQLLVFNSASESNNKSRGLIFLWGRGGGGIGLKIRCIFRFTGRWSCNWRCAYICVCLCVCVCVCVGGGGGGGGAGGRRGLISGSLLFVFRHRSPFSEESLRCLVAVDL